MTNLFELVGLEEEVATEEDLQTQSAGANYVKTNGMFKGTIERAFMSKTKAGGYSANLHIEGDSIISLSLYVLNMDKKTKKLVVDGNWNGKVIKNSDAVNLLHLYYICTGNLVSISKLPLVNGEVEYKAYGKDVKEEVLLMNDLVGKTINYSLTAKEKYSYEDGEEDKTCLKTDKEGNLVYDLKVLRFYNEDKFVPQEIITEATEALQYEKDLAYVTSDKAIKKLELEDVTIYEDEIIIDVDEDEIPF